MLPFILGIFGALAGGAAFSWSALAISIGMMAGTLLGQALSPGQSVKGPRLENFQAQNSQYNMAIPEVIGRARVGTNVIWSGGLEEVVIENKEGFISKTTITTYQYYCSFACAICKGPIIGVSRMWAYGNKIYDVTSAATNEEHRASRKLIESGAIKIYLGSSSQEPDATVIRYESDNAQAWRDIAYIVFDRLFLEPYGNTIPAISVEIFTSGAQEISEVAAIDQAVFANNLVNAGTCQYMGQQWIVGGIVDGALYNDYIHSADGALWIQEHNYTAIWNLQRIQPIEWAGLNNGTAMVVLGGREEIYTKATTRGIGWIFQLGEWKPITVRTDPFPRDSYGACVLNGQILFYGGMNKQSGGTTYYDDLWRGVNNLDGTPRKWTRLIETALPGDRESPTLLNWNDTVYLIGGKHYNYSGTDDSNGVYELASGLTSFSELTDDLTGDGAASKLVLRACCDANYLYALVKDISLDQFLIYQSSDGETWTQLYAVPTDDFSAAGFDYDNLPTFFMLHGDFYIQGGTGAAGSGKMVFTRLIATFEDVTLADTVDAIADMAGIDASLINKDGLDAATYTGYPITNQTSGIQALQPLQQAFFFDLTESEGQIKFVSRGGSVAATIDSGDLSAHSEIEDEPDGLEQSIPAIVDLPKEVIVSYYDLDQVYNQGSQSALKINSISRQRQAIQVPVVLQKDKAAQIANVLLHEIYSAASTIDFSIPLKYLSLDPTDVITIDEGGINRTIRLSQITRKGGVLACKGVLENSTIYSKAVVPATPETPPNDPGAIFSNLTVYGAFLDIPILSDLDDGYGFYFGVVVKFPDQIFNGINELPTGWKGATVYRIWDNGYPDAVGFVKDAMITGILSSGLDEPLRNIPLDRGPGFTVQFHNGPPRSISHDDILNGKNLALLGSYTYLKEGQGELLQFQDVIDNEDGTYTLKNLVRGLYGTQARYHGPGEWLWILDNCLRFSIPREQIGVPVLYRVQALGSDQYTDRWIEAGSWGSSCSAPIYFTAQIDATTNDVTLSWIRQTRMNAEWLDSAEKDVPIGEEEEVYQIDFYDGDTVVHTEEVKFSDNIPGYRTFTLSADDQTAIFGAPLSAVKVKVYQMSKVAGRGTGSEFAEA